MDEEKMVCVCELRFSREFYMPYKVEVVGVVVWAKKGVKQCTR